MVFRVENHKLSQAPLVYVLAQVSFNQVLSMEKFIPQIQEEVREFYPRFSEGKVQNLRFSRTNQAPEVTTIKIWEFADKDRNYGIVLQNDSLVFHTTAYTIFEEFLSKIEFVLEVVGKIVNLALVERVGLRYVDFVQGVDKADDLNSYFTPGLAGFSDSDGHKLKAQEQFEARRVTDLGTIVIKLTKKLNFEILPPDLVGVSLNIGRKVIENIPNAILDIDHYCEQSLDYSVVDISDCIERLHKNTSSTFYSNVTPHALSTWR